MLLFITACSSVCYVYTAWLELVSYDVSIYVFMCHRIMRSAFKVQHWKEHILKYPQAASPTSFKSLSGHLKHQSVRWNTAILNYYTLYNRPHNNHTNASRCIMPGATLAIVKVTKAWVKLIANITNASVNTACFFSHTEVHTLAKCGHSLAWRHFCLYDFLTHSHIYVTACHFILRWYIIWRRRKQLNWMCIYSDVYLHSPALTLCEVRAGLTNSSIIIMIQWKHEMKDKHAMLTW